MSRVKIPEDLQLRLRAFQRTRGLHWRELGEILNVSTLHGLGWIFDGEVPAYVVDKIARLVAPPRVDITSVPEIVADVAVRYGIAERFEEWPHGSGLTLHVGSYVAGWPTPLPVQVPTREFSNAVNVGETETWRFLHACVAGYVAAAVQARKAVAA